MRFFTLLGLFFLFCDTRGFSQCAKNIGFEEGNFDGWVSYKGTINAAGVVSVASGTPDPEFHRIISRANAGFDKYGKFPTICPNGSAYSVRLGDDYPGRAERLSYEFNIPAGSATAITLNYAVVLANPVGHTDVQQARFTLKLFNVTDNAALSCPSFDFIARTGAGFVQSDVKAGPNVDETVFFKDWSTAIINLDGYQGKRIRFDFTTSDCTQGEHLGYAYFDIDETCGTIGSVSGNVFCEGQTQLTLRGPNGYDNYTWYKGNGVVGQPLGSGQTLVINSPVDQDDYTLALTSNYGLCPDLWRIKLEKKPTPFTMNVQNKLYGCKGGSVDLNIAGLTPGLIYTFHKDLNSLDRIASPQAVTTPGIYYIKGTSLPEGCTDIKPVEVLFEDPPSVNVTPPAAVEYPATVDLSTTHDVLPDVKYSYYKNSNATEQVDKTISISGTYYIRATYNTSCLGTVAPVAVTITPPPTSISAPNTFTPNNDGVNDEFLVTVGGYITFNRLQVFNRYGTAVFTTRSPGIPWRGTHGNKTVPTGTYYWVFEGVDPYLNAPVRKAGSITIIR